MRRFLGALMAFTLTVLVLNAATLRADPTIGSGTPGALISETAYRIADAARLTAVRSQLRSWSSWLHGTQQIITAPDGDAWRAGYVGDSVMADLAPALDAALADQSGQQVASAAVIQPGMTLASPLGQWETRIRAAFDDLRPTVVFVTVDVGELDAERHRVVVDGFLDVLDELGVQHVVWVTHPPSLHASYESNRELSERLLRNVIDARSDVQFLDVSHVVVGSSGAYTAYVKDGLGNVVRVRELDGIHLAEPGAELVAREIVQRISALGP